MKTSISLLAILVCAVAYAVPNAPSNLSAAAVSDSQINLAWRDNSTRETDFRLQRHRLGAFFARVATLSANTTRYSDSGLLPGTTYYYRIAAHNATGFSPWSNIAVATTGKPKRDITIDFINATIGDTYEILVAPTGQTLFSVGTSTATVAQVVVPNLSVGKTYDFAAIVWRGSLHSVQSPVVLHYTITKALNQKLLGVAP